ncbi:MAG: leukotoxin LktA family filamentous adhesin [Vampirovibrionia bacterium]
MSCITLAATVSVLPVGAQNITIDGNTNTILDKNGNITNISTSTIYNKTGFNSFNTFNISESEVVNLLLPASTSTLVNLIKQGHSNINGVLNSIMDNKPGGNIFLVNPHGVIVGNTGFVNVGSLVVTTPTTNFVDSFFDSPGVVNVQSFDDLKTGNYPINTEASFKNYGVIQALEGVKLSAGSVLNAGQITTGCIAEHKVDFNDVINIENLENADYIVANGSTISIKAQNDLTNTGSIAAYSLNNSENNMVTLRANDINLSSGSEIIAKGLTNYSNGGIIDILAENDTVFAENSILDVSAGSESGDGGFIELSAKNTVFSYGQFKASSNHGKSGTIFIDPDEVIINNVFTDGADFIVNADNIIVQSVTISTRNIADPVNGDHYFDPSEGDSGRVEFNTPGTIDLQPFSEILTFADNGFNSGAVDFNADFINLNIASINSGETTFNFNDLAITDNSTVASDANIILNAADAGSILIDSSFIHPTNGFSVIGPNASAVFNDDVVLAEGENGINIDLQTLEINSTATDTLLIALDSSAHLVADNFNITPESDTSVSIFSSGDLTLTSDDMYFNGYDLDNSTVNLGSSGDININDISGGNIDLYNTDITAGNGLFINAPDSQVVILDSCVHSSGINGIDINTFMFAFVADEYEASMQAYGGPINIDSFVTVFEAGLGVLDIGVNAATSDLIINSPYFEAASVESNLNVSVFDGDIIINAPLVASIVSDEGNENNFTTSNDIIIDADALYIADFTVNFNAGNNINLYAGDSDVCLVAGANFTTGNEFLIDAPDSFFEVYDTTINAQSVSINLDNLYLEADMANSIITATDGNILFSSPAIEFSAINSDIEINSNNGLVFFGSPEIDFNVPNVDNTINITAQNIMIFGDSIIFNDPDIYLTPGLIQLNAAQQIVFNNAFASPQDLASINPQIEDVITTSDMVDNYIALNNTDIYTDTFGIMANSDVQILNTYIEANNGLEFFLEQTAIGDDTTLSILDSDIVNQGENGIYIEAPAVIALTLNDNLSLTASTSDIIVNSDFVNIFGNFAGSTLELTAANNVEFTGEHVNLGENLFNPFDNDFTFNITAGNKFKITDFTETTARLNNLNVNAYSVEVTSSNGVAAISDSYIESTGPGGIYIAAAELGFLSDQRDMSLIATGGNITLGSDTDLIIWNSYNEHTTFIDALNHVYLIALGNEVDSGYIDMATTEIDADNSIQIYSAAGIYAYANTDIYSSSEIVIVSPCIGLGVNEFNDEPVGLRIESPVGLRINTDNLSVDTSADTLVGANALFSINRQTVGDIYYGNNEPADSLNITPAEMNNLWSSFIILGNYDENSLYTNNIVIDGPINLPNGIALYSNDTIEMNPFSSIWAFSTVMNTESITVGEGTTVNSDMIDLTADTFNISTLGGTAITGNSEVRIDRLTPGDFVISDTGNLQGINSVSAVGALIRKVSLGLNSNNLENVEIGQAINMPNEFEIQAQGNIYNTTGTNDINITSQGLIIDAKNVGEEDGFLKIDLTSGSLSLDLKGNAYIKAYNNDVMLEQAYLVNLDTSEYFDLLMFSYGGSILQTANNAIDLVAENAGLFSVADIDIDAVVNNELGLQAVNLDLTAQADIIVGVFEGTVDASDILAAYVMLFADGDVSLTDVYSGYRTVVNSLETITIDNLQTSRAEFVGINGINADNLDITDLAIFFSDENIDLQGDVSGVLTVETLHDLNLNNTSTTNIDTVEAADVYILSYGSILDANGTADLNITADNITLISTNGAIGTKTEDLNVSLNASRIDANAYGVVNIKSDTDFELGTVISNTSDVRLEACDGIIFADNGIVRGNNIALLANEIQVSENTIIQGTANVGLASDTFVVNTPISPAIEADGAIILSRYTPGGMVFTNNGLQDLNSRADIHLDFDLFVADELIIGNDALTNYNTSTIFIDDQIIYDRNKLTLSANGLIYDRNDNLPSVVANNLTLISGNDIGQIENMLDISIENNLVVQAIGDVYLKDHNKDLVIDTIQNTDGSIYLSTATGDIYIGTINALKKIVIDAGGKLVSIQNIDPEDIIVSVADSSGTITINDGEVSNSVNLKANTITANLTDTGTTGVTFDLSNINNTKAGLINIIANSRNSMTFNRLYSDSSTISNNITGGSVVFNNADISNTLVVNADNISTPNNVNVQLASLSGANAGMANSIQFSTVDSLKLTTLKSNTADINTYGDILDISNAQVNEYADFHNSSKYVVLDNVGRLRDYSSIDAILYTKDIFNLYLDGSKDIKTNAMVIYIRPDLTLNGTRTGDEVGKVLCLTTHQAYSYMDNALYNTYYKDYTSDLLNKQNSNVLGYLPSAIYNDEQDLGITNYFLDKAVNAYYLALAQESSDSEALEAAVISLNESNISKQLAQQLLDSPQYSVKEIYERILGFYLNN